MSTSRREQLHHLVDELPDRQLPDAERYLAKGRRTDSPLRRALANAPEEGEPLTLEVEAAFEEAYIDIAASGTIPNEEFWRQLNDGLTS